ncbi:ATP-binding protein [Leptospira kirschneri]|uniref:HD domain-containing protein n=1 Tax=Leptospira kirschneri TaxID=29507 RepID=UPI001E3315D1|nr:ATP-binding protein [Leptospira kirschneri]
MSLIYQNLKLKCQKNLDLTPLLTQWELDKIIIGKALKNISINFPHYSLHDESHSNTIINQIEKILGEERISRLSAIDSWLLLEACYSHDLGMIIPKKKIEEAFESEEFNRFLNQIILNPFHELHENAKLILGEGIKELIQNKKNTWSLEIQKSVTLLVAAFFRPTHHESTRNIIENPYTEINLESPRTHLIPKRIYKILGKICESHGKNFSAIMTLDKNEDGLANEMCNPRFIAVLLRLGDLLDLDNGRFCEVLISCLGDLPHSSKNHYNKHHSIEHLFISKERIEIKAICKDYESYSLTVQWLDWIKDEIKNINENFYDIIPYFRFGSFPDVKNLQVQLEGYELIKNYLRPKIQLDSESVIKLIQGKNIYDSKFISIRELIQNSSDATLIRLFLEFPDRFNNPKSIKDFIENDKFPEKFYIQIELNKIENKVNDKTVWNFKIQDSGIGISRNDLEYLLDIGSSKKNTNKQEIIKKMPEWLRPSGVFGIGFQSVFMLTEKVTIKTKSLFSNESLEIIIYSPQGEKDAGNVLIKKINSKNTDLKFGTEINFNIEMDAIPNMYSYSWDNEYAKSIINEFDPLFDKEFSIETAELKYRIDLYSQNSLIPVHFGQKKEKTKSYDKFPIEKSLYFFDEIENIEFYTIPVFEERPTNIFLYRNQEIDTNSEPPVPLFRFKVNILSSNAENLLTLDRKKIKSEKKKDLIEKIKCSFNKAVPTFYNSLKNKVESSLTKNEIESYKNIFSLYQELYFEKNKSFSTEDEWKKILFYTTIDENIKFESIFQCEKLDINFSSNRFEYGSKTTNVQKINDQHFKLTISENYSLFNVFKVFLFKKFLFYKINKIEYKSEEITSDFGITNNPPKTRIISYTFSNLEIDDTIIELSCLTDFFSNTFQNYRNESIPKRLLIPYFHKKYEMLAFGEDKDEIFKALPYLWHLDEEFRYWNRFIISPIVIEDGVIRIKGINEVIQLLCSNGLELNTESAQQLYKELANELINSIQKIENLKFKIEQIK